MRNVAILFNTTFGFAHKLMAGVSRGWASHPDWDFLLYQQEYPKPAELREWRVDGIIGLFGRNWPVNPYLKLRVPIVNISSSRLPAPVVSVNVDQRAVGRAAALHLFDKDVASYGFAGYQESDSSRGRLAGFRSVLRKRRRDCNVHWIAGAYSHWPEGFERWLAVLRKPAAVFVASDSEARLLLSVCRHMGLNVPEDVAVLGVNNEEDICLTCRPMLSSIPTGLQYIGEYATAIMGDWLSGKRPAKRIIEFMPGAVIERGSTQRSRGLDDPLVAQAIRWMRENLGQGIGVREVAGVCGVSQRALEYHFHAAAGRSPGKVLQQLRFDEATELLVHTELTLDEVARRIGFRSAQYMSTFFQKHCGFPPAAYRKHNRFGGESGV